jgi:hypothetical protein
MECYVKKAGVKIGEKTRKNRKKRGTILFRPCIGKTSFRVLRQDSFLRQKTPIGFYEVEENAFSEKTWAKTKLDSRCFYSALDCGSFDYCIRVVSVEDADK